MTHSGNPSQQVLSTVSTGTYLFAKFDAGPERFLAGSTYSRDVPKYPVKGGAMLLGPASRSAHACHRCIGESAAARAQPMHIAG